MHVEEESHERPWAWNSRRLTITLGITGSAQEGSFTNATLQHPENEPNLAFSIAVHVDVPADVTDEDALAEYLDGIFGDVVHEHPELHVEIQLGPENRY
jgi:hypothetical protein